MLWRKITLAGVGLLGGSLGLAIRQRRLAERVEGYVRREASIAECERLGIVHRATLDPAEAVAGADLIILCTPLARMRELLEQMLPALERGAIVTDVGSVKGPVVRELAPLVSGAGGYFVGSHPMAGAEKMGASAARADLFDHAVCIVTPDSATPAHPLERVESFWRELGTRTLRLSPDLHDELVARCSHLPHLAAATLATLVLDPRLPREQPALCASGFRDTTRVASGSPEMWRDIALANRENLVRIIGEFTARLDELRQAIERGDGPALDEFLSTAKQRRDAWRAQAASPSPE
jgi:prephenate dehydrogenase